MANNIKGITVEIGGNIGPLNSALKGVNSTSRNLQSELKEVNRQLKFDPKNTELLKQKQDLLTQSTEALKQKQAVLKQAVQQAHEQFEKGDLGADKVRAVDREYAKVNSQLKDLDKQANSTSVFGKISSKLGVTAQNIKTAVGAAGIATVSFLKSCVSDAAEAGNAQANLVQTIKSTGDASGLTAKQMTELAEKEVNLSTFSNDDIESGEAMLATFTKIGKDVFPQASQAVLDFAQKMGTDPKTAALTLGKALNDPTIGLSKLTKSGVTFTAQQQKQIKAMEAVGNTAGAQKLMIAELNREFGGQAAAAAGTYAGKQKQLANQFKEVKESIGNALIPILTKLGSFLVKILQPIAAFISAHPKISAAILAIIAVIGTLVGGLSVLTTVTAAFGITLDVALLPTIGLVVLAIAAVIAIAALVITHWKPISAFFVGLWKGISSGVSAAFNGIKNFFSGIWTWLQSFFKKWGTVILAVLVPFIGIPLLIKQHFGQIAGFFSGIWTWLQSFFKKWGTVILAVLVPFIGIPLLIKQHFGQITGWLSGIWNSVVGGVSGFVGNVGKTIGGISGVIVHAFDGAINFIKDLPGNMLKWGGDMITGLINGIKGMIGKVGDAVGSVANKIKSFLHFSVPDEGPLTNYESWMPDFMGGLAKGITNNTDKVHNAVKNLAPGMSVKLNSAISMPQLAYAGVSGTASAPSVQQVEHKHSGTIKVEGVNNQQQTVAVVDMVLDELRKEQRR